MWNDHSCARRRSGGLAAGCGRVLALLGWAAIDNRRFDRRRSLRSAAHARGGRPGRVVVGGQAGGSSPASPQLRSYVRWRELLESKDPPRFRRLRGISARGCPTGPVSAPSRRGPRRRWTPRSRSTSVSPSSADSHAAHPPGADAVRRGPDRGWPAARGGRRICGRPGSRTISARPRSSCSSTATVRISTAEAHAARLDRLLWDGRIDQARRMLPRVGPSERALADARLKLQRSDSGRRGRAGGAAGRRPEATRV